MGQDLFPPALFFSNRPVKPTDLTGSEKPHNITRGFVGKKEKKKKKNHKIGGIRKSPFSREKKKMEPAGGVLGLGWENLGKSCLGVGRSQEGNKYNESTDF